MQPSEARDHLRSVRVLKDISDAALDRVARAVTWRSTASGETIVSHREQGDGVFFIVEGACKVKLSPATGSAVALRRISAGDHFGEIAALKRAPRSVTVISDGACTLAELPRQDFAQLMLDEPAFAEAIAQRLADHVISLTERVFELAALQVRFRLYAELLRLIQDGEMIEDGILLPATVTRVMLAATIGSQREAVSREIKTLMNENIMRRERTRLVITDVAELRRRVEGQTGFAS